MEPTVLQQLYLSKHTVRISAEHILYDGYIAQIGNMISRYIPRKMDVMYECLTYDPEPNIPIIIAWNKVENISKLIDYYYLIHQCITDLSTIEFGFNFSSYISRYGPNYYYCASFKLDVNGIITGICNDIYYIEPII